MTITPIDLMYIDDNRPYFEKMVEELSQRKIDFRHSRTIEDLERDLQHYSPRVCVVEGYLRKNMRSSAHMDGGMHAALLIGKAAQITETNPELIFWTNVQQYIEIARMGARMSYLGKRKIHPEQAADAVQRTLKILKGN